MTAMLLTAVPGWIWQTTTILTWIVTLALIAVLIAHVVIGGAASAPERQGSRAVVLRRLAIAAVPALVCLAILVSARFVVILIDRPGR